MGAHSRTGGGSRAAAFAAFPVRTATVMRYNAHALSRSASWLVRSREHTNFTYDLTPRNREHLIWWVSAVSGSPAAEIRGYVEELDHDVALRRHLHAGDGSQRAPRTRRPGRPLQPARRLVCDDPDPAAGRWSSRPAPTKAWAGCVFAAALAEERKRETDHDRRQPRLRLPIAGEYADVVDRVIGDSLQGPRGAARPVDLFLHDSLHTFEHETAELTPAAATDATGACCCPTTPTAATLSWLRQEDGRSFLFFQEVPKDHWYPGDGIGAAWTPPSDSAVSW